MNRRTSHSQICKTGWFSACLFCLLHIEFGKTNEEEFDEDKKLPMKTDLNKWLFTWFFGTLFVLNGFDVRAQTIPPPVGFTNLNFELARIAGAQPGSSVPIGDGLPYWNVGGQIGGRIIDVLGVYCDYAVYGGDISIYDSHATDGIVPLQGNYSAVVVTGGSLQLSLDLYETAMIPSGTKSVLVEASSSIPGVPLQIEVSESAIGGLSPPPVEMAVPLETTPTYTVYGCDVSAFAGHTSSIGLIFSSAAGDPLNKVEVDDMMFSTNPIPEPGTGWLLLSGLILLWAAIRKNNLKDRASCIISAIARAATALMMSCRHQ